MGGLHYRLKINQLDSQRDALRAQNRPQEALRPAVEAMQLAQKQLGLDHDEAITRAHAVAGLLRDCGRTDEAESVFVQALGAARGRLGHAHPHIITLSRDLAELYAGCGKKTDAERTYRALLESMRASSSGGPALANVLVSLAGLCPGEAVACYQEALAARPGHEKALAALLALGVEPPAAGAQPAAARESLGCPHCLRTAVVAARPSVRCNWCGSTFALDEGRRLQPLLQLVEQDLWGLLVGGRRLGEVRAHFVTQGLLGEHFDRLYSTYRKDLPFKRVELRETYRPAPECDECGSSQGLRALAAQWRKTEIEEIKTGGLPGMETLKVNYDQYTLGSLHVLCGSCAGHVGSPTFNEGNPSQYGFGLVECKSL